MVMMLVTKFFFFVCVDNLQLIFIDCRINDIDQDATSLILSDP